MDIEFPGPATSAEDGGVSYRAIVDGNTVSCKFSWETLQDVNPARTEDPAMQQFQDNKALLLSIAKEKIQAGKIQNNIVQIFTADLP